MITPSLSRQLAIAYREGTWLVGGLIGFTIAGPQHPSTALAAVLGGVLGFAAALLRTRLVRVERSGSHLVVQNFWSRSVLEVGGDLWLELGPAPLRGPWFPRLVAGSGKRHKVQAVVLSRDVEVATLRLNEVAADLGVQSRP